MDATPTARFLIENNELMIVATANSAGKPWISPVGYSYDANFNLYWVSDKDALHSESIRNRPEVAIVIVGRVPNKGLDGLYVDAKACELTNAVEIESAIKVIAKRNQDPKYRVNSPKDVSGEAVWRIYRAVPTEFSKRADTTIKGQAVTVRKPVEL